MNFVLVYITNPTKKEAERIATHLLRKKLIACANILGPTESIYPSQGKLICEAEYILIAKTTAPNFLKVRKETEKIHPYAIPCILKIPVRPNKKYFDWAKKIVANKP